MHISNWLPLSFPDILSAARRGGDRVGRTGYPQLVPVTVNYATRSVTTAQTAPPIETTLSTTPPPSTTTEATATPHPSAIIPDAAVVAVAPNEQIKNVSQENDATAAGIESIHQPTAMPATIENQAATTESIDAPKAADAMPEVPPAEPAKESAAEVLPPVGAIADAAGA